MIFSNNLNLKSLHCFVTIVQSGGFAQAQGFLNMSPSTISNHITSLESQLGFRLCERGPRGFALTENGRVVYKNALLLLQQTEDFWNASHTIKNTVQGTVLIGCMDMTHTDPNNKIQDILYTIHTQNPNIDFRLEYMPYSHLESAILKDDLHIALCSSPKNHHLLDYIPLYEEQLFLYVGHNHKLYAMDDKTISDDLLNAQLFSDRYYDTANIAKTPKYIGFSDNAEAHLAYIKSGLALGLLPKHVADPYCQSGALRSIRVNDIHHNGSVNLVFKRVKTKTRLLKHVINTVCDIYHIQRPF